MQAMSVEQFELALKEKLKAQSRFMITALSQAPGESGGIGCRSQTGSARPRRPQVSGTNLQEQGVDEADLVKTDGRFLFAANGTAGIRIFDTQGQLKQVAALGFGKGVQVQGLYLLAEHKQLLVVGKVPRRYGAWCVVGTTVIGAGKVLLI
ncbi:MAG: beta-propeller domain-containing protein [Thiolinea sp.]